MTARAALAFVYRQVVARCDEDERLEVDALLFNDETAEQELQRRRREAIMAMGGDIG